MKILSKNFVLSCVEKLNEVQKKLFIDYGLRQIKWMFEKDDVMRSSIPDGAKLIGLSQPFIRWTAIDYDNKVRYGFFKGQNPEWSEADLFKPEMQYDKVEDFKSIYDIFGLNNYDLDVLTHVHRNYIEWGGT